MPQLIELPESLVRSLAAEHLSSTRQRQNERLEFYFLLWMYGDAKLHIGANCKPAHIAARMSRGQVVQLDSYRRRIDRALTKAKAIMEPILAEAKIQAVQTVAYAPVDVPEPTFRIVNHKSRDGYSLDITQKRGLKNSGVLWRETEDYRKTG